MEKHYLHIPQRHNVSFVQIQIQAESGQVLSLITVFYVKFVLIGIRRNNLLTLK
jgi:hypothetical protein